MHWKKGRSKLGPLEPLLGTWRAEADSQMGPVKCTRTFTKVLGGKFIELRSRWELEKSDYEEIALIGPGDDKLLHFWSFTSDGKHSEGVLAPADDIHPDAVCFEAEMPAGLARQVYWPDDKEGFHWVVESKTKKGWNRFTEHHYHSA